MKEISLQTKAEALSGLYGELAKRQADFENYAESVLREAIAQNGYKPVKFRTTDLRDKTYEVMLRPDTFYACEEQGSYAFSESESGEEWNGLREVHNVSIVELVRNITEAVEKGKEA